MNLLLLKLYRWNWVPYLVIAAVASWQLFDTFVPVVRGQAELVSRSPDTVVLHLWGSKLRACRYVGIQAFSRVDDGINRGTIITRVDLPAMGTTKPTGDFDFGRWSIRPVAGATSVSVYVQHACDADDLRTTKIAEVKL